MKWKKGLATLAVLLAALPLGIVVDGLSDRLGPADVAVIPGSMVHPDGRLSARLQARLDKAVELYRQGLFAHLIVSGGTGVEGVDEAVAMKTYLLAQQVPEAAILVDSGGATTHDTAVNSAALMRARGWRSAMVVTQYFHVPRTRLALAAQGVSPLYNVHASFFEARDVYSTLREVPGLASYWWKARVRETGTD